MSEELTKEQKKKIIVGQKCPFCGYKVRGINHIDGDHHQSGGKGEKKNPYE